jgi:hypothetical protein
MNSLLSTLRYGTRILLKRPGLSALAASRSRSASA